MTEEFSLAGALTAEHHEIDSAIETFMEGLARGAEVRILAPLMRSVIRALRRHIYLEEVFAFPPIREGALSMPIMVMEREHGVLWRAMDALEKTLDDFDDVLASDDDHRAIIDACTEMLATLESHNSKEEPIIYPHLDAELSPDAAAQLRELIEVGSTPEGWVCARAREA